MLYENDFLKIQENEGDIYLKVHQKGMQLQAFNDIVDDLARVKLTTFQTVQLALRDATDQWVIIGELKEVVELTLTADMMQAHLIINLEKNNYRTQEEVGYLVEQTLEASGISYGIDRTLLSHLPWNEKVLIAEGKAVVQGSDAVVTYFELKNKRPFINQRGLVNHYERDLIDNVLAGEILGQKIPPTSGVNGINVKGEVVYAKVGRNHKLRFDPKTVKHEENEDSTETLYAKINGAVKFRSGKIMVDNHLIIHGDVDYETGHIDFDGYVTITGTVKDKFNVSATYDISINGPMGIGAVGEICSKKGSILIKGGINGKGSAKIRAYKDVVSKYVNEAFVEAGHAIQVGLYVIDSELSAKRIMLPPDQGRIIGGKTYATHRIETGSIGNRVEKPTRVYVEGFVRDDIIEMLEVYRIKSVEINKVLTKMKRDLAIFEKNMTQLDERAINTYEYLLVKYEEQVNEYDELRLELLRLDDVLQTKGEGEICIANQVFPRTLLEMKSLQKRIHDKTSGSFYVIDRTIHHIG